MLKEDIYTMRSPYRDDFRLRGYFFGCGEKSAAIVGPMRGDEIEQQLICSQIVSRLREIESLGGIAEGRSILVIPSCNPFSMNVGRRFWAMDGTDINRMFPGYDQGETTQRIAAWLFRFLQDYRYGIQLASYYLPGYFIPHVRTIETGYEDVSDARRFGFRVVTTYKPLPYDTTFLNYNWQIWNTKAFSLYAGCTDIIDESLCRLSVDAIMRFLVSAAILDTPCGGGYESVIVDESTLVTVCSSSAGLFLPSVSVGERVAEGQPLARVIDPYDGSLIEEALSPADGLIFFAHSGPLCLERGILFRIIHSDAV